MVAGAILAAGRSVRMGQPKAMLRTPDGLTFVARLIRTLSTGGVDAPLVVARSDDDLLRSEVESAGARLVINPDTDEGGQLSSLLAGLRKADRPGVRALMVVPVDAPMVMPETVAKLIAVFNDSHGSIIRARYQEGTGILSFFACAVRPTPSRTSGSRGEGHARAHAHDIVNVDVDDPGVIGDIDTPEDYDKLRAST
jgi:CTP:molybdopterin cytidylyltransferase MocA